MAEDDTPKRTDEDEEPPPIAVPPHDPLPLPPDVSFSRPTLGRATPIPTARPGPRRDSDARTQLSQGVQGYGLAITAAVTLAVTLILFVALGQWLDHRFNRSGVPWFTIAGLLVSVGGGFFNMIRLLTQSTRKK